MPGGNGEPELEENLLVYGGSFGRVTVLGYCSSIGHDCCEGSERVTGVSPCADVETLAALFADRKLVSLWCEYCHE